MHFTSRAFSRYAGLVLLFLVMNLFLPVPPRAHAFGVSGAQYHILLFTVLLPLAVVWCISYYGAIKLYDFARRMDGTNEGYGYRQIARGCLWLAWGFLVPAAIHQLLVAIAAGHPAFQRTAVIVMDYVNLAVPLVAFSIIGTGSRALLEQAKTRTTVHDTKRVVILFAIIGVLFCYYTFRQLNLHDAASSSNVYFLPGWALVLTVVIPYLYAWFIGLLAAFEINRLGAGAKGVLYRRAMQLLAGGLTLVIATSIAYQCILTIIPSDGKLALDYLLLLIYITEIAEGIGFLLIVRGAERLKRIEEV